MNKPGFLLRVFYAAVLIAIACSCSRRQEAVRLLDAAESGDLAKVKALVEQGAPINWTSEMTFGWTPLIGASFHFQTNVIAYLVEKGADVNVADQSGETALMWLMVRGDESVPMVKLLIEHGANLAAKNKAGGTVFDMAHSDQLVQVLEAARKQQKESHKP